MPWSNVPKSKWPQMERCVNDLKSQGKSEQSANAICYTSIMGTKKKTNKINTEGGDKMTKQKKAEEIENITKEDAVEEVVAEETVVETVAEETTEETEAPVKEEAVAEEVKPEIESEEEIVAADPVGDLVKQVLSKVEEIQASLKEEKESASAEGAVEDTVVKETAEETAEETPVVEVAPEVSASDAVVEETPAQADESSEGTDKIAKVADSLNKIADSIANLEKRIDALEAQPVPSKVVSPKIVTKGGDSNPEDSNPRLQEIETELSKLEDMRNKNVDQYQKERGWERAFALIGERDQIKGS